MRRFLPLLLLPGCSAPPIPAARPALVVVEPRIEAAPPVVVAEPAQKVILSTEGGLVTHRLGDALYVSYFTEVRPTPRIRLARVEGDGWLTDLAAGIPPSRWVRARSGDETLSGDVSALLGEPDGPWMAFRPYSIFGAALMHRVESSAWKSGSIGADGWVGDITAKRSRGHLFAIVNRVSNEGSYFRLGRGKVEPVEAVSPFELADGSIVDVGMQVPEIADVTHAGGRRADDFWALGHGTLVHVRGEMHEQVPLPDPRCSDLLVESDGSVWLSGGRVAYRWNESSADWSGYRVVSGFGSARVVAARSGLLFVLDEEQGAPSVLRRIEL